MASINVEEYYQNVRNQFAKELPSATVGGAPAFLKMPGKTSTEMSFAVPAIVSYEADIFLKTEIKPKPLKIV